MRQGLAQQEIAARGWALKAADAMTADSVLLIDLRETSERARHGVIAGSLHVPYPALRESLAKGGVLHGLAEASGKRLVFYCAFGERSAMAVRAAQEAGIAGARHIEGGLDAWKRAGGAAQREPAPA
jgi:rhodanese-related sulfurtransferase